MGRKQERFKTYIEFYVNLRKGNDQKMADILGVSKNAVKLWSQGKNLPFLGMVEPMIEKIDEVSKEEFQQSVQAYVEMNPEENKKTLARACEVAVSTVDRWIRGASCPMFRMRYFILNKIPEE